MNELWIGIIGIVVLLVFFVLEMPIAIAMALVGFIGLCILSSVHGGLNLLARDIYLQFSVYSLTAITSFVMMGCYAFATGITSRLYDASYKWAGQYRGGLAMASVVACAFFAAICGSSAATAATVGKIALPEMLKRGYQGELAAGCVASGGTLGILIPPSSIMIVYGVITQQSIGKLFIAGIVPGVILTLLFVGVIYITCKRNPNAGPQGPHTSWGAKFKSLTGLVEVVVLFGLVIGGLFAGFFTPTQAGGIGAAGALIIGLARKELTWKKFYHATKDGMMLSCMILFIVAGATIFGHFVTISTLPTAFANMAASLTLPPWVTLAMIVVVYLIGGCFIDIMPLMLLTVPIFYPIVISVGYDGVWFCILVVLVSQAANLTPPVGVNVFVIHGIAKEISIQRVFKGSYPFLGAIIVMIILIIIFPQIATWFPSFTRY